MIYDSAIIREVQLEALDSLHQLDYICRKYSIMYWLDYGTLLGAVRHHGFIPWDDDLDVGMLREDYERLCAVPAQEWGDNCLFLNAESDDPRHDVLFARIYRKRSRIQCFRDLERWTFWSNGRPWSTMLTLDIFIFDHVPDSEKTRMRMYRKSVYGRGLYQGFAFQYRSVKLRANISQKQISSRLIAFYRREYGRFMRMFYSRPWLIIWNRHAHMIARSQKGSRIGTFTTTDPFAYEETDFFPLSTGIFEDIPVPIPKCWDRHLRDVYGDYMQIPPEDSRQHLDFAVLDIGNGHHYDFRYSC